MTIRISIICQTEESRAHVAASDPMGIGATIRACVGGARDLGRVLAQDMPDVSLLELPTAEDASMEQIEQALQQAPATHLVLVSPEHSEAFLMRAMRAGVREVLPGPMSPETVQLAVKPHDQDDIMAAAEADEDLFDSWIQSAALPIDPFEEFDFFDLREALQRVIR